MAWGSASGAPWAGHAPVRTIGRLQPRTSRGPALSAFTEVPRRVGGWAVSEAVCVALLLSAYPANRLTAQGVLSQFSYENLKPSAVQFDVGPLAGNNIRGALTGGLRLDYGL